VHFNGHKAVAGPGSTLFYSSMDMHNVRNVGDTRATYWVVNVATAATHDPALKNKTPKLQSAVYDYEKLEVKPSKVGEGRRVLDGSTVTLKNLETHITTINAGEAPHAPHRHPDEEIVLVRDGTLEVNINEKTFRAGPGSVLLLASNDMHGWRNVGTTRAQYHVIRLVTEATPKAEGKK
jgi:quercetin dioxygenase-like cupin family protein